MESLSGLRRKNAAAAPTKNGAAGPPLVLPEVQTGEHHQCAEFSNRDHKSARRKDAVLTAISVVMHCIFFRRKKHEEIIGTEAGICAFTKHGASVPTFAGAADWESAAE